MAPAKVDFGRTPPPQPVPAVWHGSGFITIPAQQPLEDRTRRAVAAAALQAHGHRHRPGHVCAVDALSSSAHVLHLQHVPCLF